MSKEPKNISSVVLRRAIVTGYVSEESQTKPVSAACQSPGMTNCLGKAFGPIINTSPMRSHLCLWPDSGLCTSGPVCRSRSPFCPHESPLRPPLPCSGQFPPGFLNLLINTVTFRVTCLDIRDFSKYLKAVWSRLWPKTHILFVPKESHRVVVKSAVSSSTALPLVTECL